MATKTVYPYGTEGSLPSSIGIVNDCVTGGVDKALAAEQGKYLANLIVDSTFPDSAKQQIIDTFKQVAWVTEDVQGALDELALAMDQMALDSITAVFTQGQTVVTNATPLNSLRKNLVVTGSGPGGISVVINDYVLSGELTVGTSTITVTYGTLTTTFTVSVIEYGTIDFVPEGYTLIEYISTNGVPYIDLNFKANEATDAYYVDLMFTTITAQMRILSANEASTRATIYVNGSLAYGIRYRATNSAMSYSPIVNQRHNIYVSYKDRVTKANGEDVENTLASSGTTGVSGGNVLLVGPATTNPRFVGRIYRVKIFRNSALLRELVPCRDSNNVGYMYDMYNDVMYSRSGGGSFGLGPDAND